ncbi:malonyl-CoA:anthocyanidin O-glucoside-6''-O-malonyltransferase [Salix suchowensis]|nr:malonyl-CoA:anthocyanidin O-glucoside-6''-O-malonyltransferase [Salix suchowensis]
MASPNSVKILEICKVTRAFDSVDASTEFSLPLTYFDITWLKFPPAECLYFFKLNESSSRPSLFHSEILPALKLSLSRTLGHFVPLAGHLTWPDNSSKPVIVYALNDALSLTVAESNANFDRFIRNEIREAVESHPYIPELHGFSIGMAIHHAVLDGRSVFMFLNAWAYLCKHNQNEKSLLLLPELRPSFDRTGVQDSFGLESVYLNQWEATIIPGSELNSRSLKVMPNLQVSRNLLRATFRLSREAINELKESVLRYHQAGSSPKKNLHLTTYVLTCAYVSVCLVRARGGDSRRKVYQVFSVDCRGRVEPPLPPNYFGNCVAVHHMVAEAEAFMEENGVAIIAEKLSELINGLGNELFQGAKERLVMLRGLGQEVQKFGVAGSTRIGFYGLDFGWGNVEKAEITSIDRATGFSVMEFGDVSSGGIEIGVVLVRQEMERFADLFATGLKALQSRL